MARTRDTDDYTSLLSEESFEAQSEIAKKYAKEIADAMKHEFDGVSKHAEKLTDAFEKNMGDTLASYYDKAQRGKAKEDAKYEKPLENILKNILKQSGEGGKYNTSGKALGMSIAAELGKLLTSLGGIYITQPIQKGFNEMANAYEANMSNIAGRMGTMRADTTSLMHSAIKQLNDSSYKNAISANKELIPALSAAADKGFKGQEAVAVALSNSVDKKIMPWLDTASSAWTNLQFNLNENELKTLKGQQLLLQESRAGNRLLQSGVINQLTSDIAPILSNISYNTYEKDSTSQLTQIMEAYVSKGFSEDQAYQKAQDLLKIWRDPMSYIGSDKANDVMQAAEVLKGGDFMDMEAVNQYFVDLAANAPNLAASGAVAHGLGVNSYNGGFRTEDFQQTAAAGDAITAHDFTDITADSDKAYESVVNKAVEKVTATSAHDNAMENITSETMYWVNEIAHGADGVNEISKTVKSILTLLGSYLIGKAASKIASGLLDTAGDALGDKVGDKVGKKLFNKIGGKASSVVTKGATGLANAATKLPGVTASSSGIAATGSLSTTLASIGGGSSVAGGAAVAAPLAVGGVAAYKGIEGAVEDFTGDGAKDSGTASAKTRGVLSAAGGVAAGVGGAAVAGGMLAAGAVNAWNPVGWGLLLGGAATVVGTAIWRAANEIDATAKAAGENAKALMNAGEEEREAREASTKSILDAMLDGEQTEADINAMRKHAVETGLMTEDEARTANTDSLTMLTQAYFNASNALDPKMKAINEAVERNVKGAVQNENDRADDNILDNQLLEYVYTGEDANGDGWGDTLDNERMKQVLSVAQTVVNSGKIDTSKGHGKQLYEMVTKDGQIGARIMKGTASAEDIASLVVQIETVSRDSSMDAADWGNAVKLAGIEGIKTNYQTATQITSRQSAYGEAIKSVVQAYELVYKNNKTRDTAQQVIDAMNRAAEVGKAVEQGYKDDIKKSSELSDTLIQADFEAAGFGDLKIPKYRTGIDYVPEDQLAEIHKGESVLRKDEAAQWRNFKSSFNLATHTQDLQAAAAENVFAATASAGNFDVTAIVEAIRSQTTSINSTLSTIIQTIQTTRAASPVGASTNADRIANLIPTTNNTRNLYSM